MAGGGIKLPLNGEYPMASLNVATFNEFIGVPLGFGTARKRDYGVFLLMSSTNREFGCEACVYYFQAS